MITRKKLEGLVYKHTHADFKGRIDGVRTILKCTNQGTCAVPLTSFTDEELLEKLPSRVKESLGL